MAKHNTPKTYEKAQITRARRKKEFIAAYEREDVASIKDAIQRVRLAEQTLRMWRRESKTFDNQVLTIKMEKQAVRAARRNREEANLVVSIERDYPDPMPFTEFRREYLGRPVAVHQEHLVTAWEDRTNRVVIMLGPPGMGKDTTAGDFVLHDLTLDRDWRVAWMMESEDFSKRRIKNRLTPYLYNKAVYRTAPDGPDTSVPTRTLIDDYGPFRWEKGMRWDDGTLVARTTWNSNEMYFIEHGAPETDPNLWATVVDGAVYGARIQRLYLSDPFTGENQDGGKPPKQRTFIKGTLRTRLDARGRLMALGTRVRAGDNWEWMLDYFIGKSRIVSQSEDGMYTKYANGTATIIVPAIQHDEHGGEVSYWPDVFPLRDFLELRDGSIVVQGTVSDAEWDRSAATPGAELVGGLLTMREADPDTFETIFQQNPPSNEGGEFTDLILDHCDNPERTLGVYKPGEILVLGVDPARAGGAAYTVWGVNPESGVATVVDFFYGEKLGVEGITNRLILEPARIYMPRAMVYEINQQSAVLELPAIKDELRAMSVDIVRHTTHQYNRNQGEVSVASMVFDMRNGMIRFPAATKEDRERMKLFKQHFKNWDIVTQARAAGGSRVNKMAPFDVCMSSWIGWVYLKGLIGKRRRESRAKVRSIPEWIRRRGSRTQATRNTTKAVQTGGPSTDLLAEYYGERLNGD